MENFDDERNMKPYEINGVKYYTVFQFAKMVKKSENAVFTLMASGNRVRKLKAERFFGKPLIPVSELTEFPFTMPGRSAEVYHYDENGNQLPCVLPGEHNDY